jgi:6-phosphogluconate dehydrogenase
MAEATAKIGVVGLGTMGANLVLNIASHGFGTTGFDPVPEKVANLAKAVGGIGGSYVSVGSLAEMVQAIEAPRIVLLMVPAGPIVDQQIEALTPLLSKGDVIVDAGNTDFNDTIRRTKALEGSGLLYCGIGVSGGELGARYGASIMAGGPPEAYAILEPILTAIAARHEGEPCVAHLGTDGAGNFVKTIHNGIEYADMQMIAEIYGIMRDGLKLDNAAMSQIFSRWNEGGLQSYLIEITGVVLAEKDPETGKDLVDLIVDSAGQKGTGRWAVIEAQKLGAGATTLEAAVSARSISSRRDERAEAEKAYAGPNATQPEFAGDEEGIAELEAALETAKIIAYAQGFAVMETASKEYGWKLPLGTIARIWRAGCIIRSRFLDDIAAGYDKGAVKNLLLAPDFIERVSKNEGALRRTVSRAALAGLPVPALSAALAYFDDYRRARGTANLTQGQRDLFGAHTFQRTDREGTFHHKWPAV